ncbi:hypothetical protein MLD38_008218 [Melastoma candidum]|uniref:Uncharacterized protein n=1 Tax=Melastoma candidum TaxID=119954 RepID=A0ACB9RTJ3_9MYRT|nr:hypothetical protein MLD38_008218 [Melastoma candidum]
MSINKKNVLQSVFGPEFRCGCGKTKIPDVIQPQPVHPRVIQLSNCKSNSTSSTSNVDSVSATFSLNIDTSPRWSDSEHDPPTTEAELTPLWGSASSLAIGGSIAVMKESDDPFGDFRDSMLRMIREKGIHSRDGLEDLLRCFLELNSTRYHKVIIRAFSEIQQGVLSYHQMTNRPGIRGGSWRWKAM